MELKYNLLSIIGPTASGKTEMACKLAYLLDAEIISGDSRQIYKSMNIGTGKDLDEYMVKGRSIPYHLIDIHPAGYKYDIYQYQHDFHNVFKDIKSRLKFPILCGGSGLYIESVLRGYNLCNVPENKFLRKQYENKSLSELSDILIQYKSLHNFTDIDTAQRAIRAIEIGEYKRNHQFEQNEFRPIEKSLVIGISINRDERREKITKRLDDRLQQGLVEEVSNLINQGIDPNDLIYYGLEYKYITLYLLGKLTYSEMRLQLEIAIHQFAKRQMTWFRGMEKRGIKIHWIDKNKSEMEKFDFVLNLLQEK